MKLIHELGDGTSRRAGTSDLLVDVTFERQFARQGWRNSVEILLELGIGSDGLDLLLKHGSVFAVFAQQVVHLGEALGCHAQSSVGTTGSRDEDIDDLEEAIHDGMLEQDFEGSLLGPHFCDADALEQGTANGDSRRSCIADKVDAETHQFGSTVDP